MATSRGNLGRSCSSHSGWAVIDEVSAHQCGAAPEAPGFVALEAALEPLIEPVDLPDAEIAADLGLTVRVTGEGGRPLPGARVRLASAEARSAVNAICSTNQGSIRVAPATSSTEYPSPSARSTSKSLRSEAFVSTERGNGGGAPIV